MYKIKAMFKLTLALSMAIITFFFLISGISFKIASTGLKLMSIKFDIRLIQEDEERNPRLDASESYEEDMAERSAIYNSEDSIIHWYANLKGVIKTIIWIADIAFIIWICLAVLGFVLNSIIEKEEKKRNKKSNCKCLNKCAK